MMYDSNTNYGCMIRTRDLRDTTAIYSTVEALFFPGVFQVCWNFPEVAILRAHQKERGLWGREWCRAFLQNVYTQ